MCPACLHLHPRKTEESCQIDTGFTPEQFVTVGTVLDNGINMENSSLNQAHFQARRAEKLTSQGKLDGAVECHIKALSLLTDATILTDVEIIQQSLHYQKEYHKKQVQLLKSKIEYLESLKKSMMGDKHRESSLAQSGQSQPPFHDRENQAQMDIMRTLSEADSALLLHADCCSSMDPNLNQLTECLRKMRQQLEQLFHLSTISDNDDMQIEAIKPADEGRYSPSVTSEDNFNEADLPILAPLEVPQFDFGMLSDIKPAT